MILTSINNGLEKCPKMLIFSKMLLRPLEEQMKAGEQESSGTRDIAASIILGFLGSQCVGHTTTTSKATDLIAVSQLLAGVNVVIQSQRRSGQMYIYRCVASPYC